MLNTDDYRRVKLVSIKHTDERSSEHKDVLYSRHSNAISILFDGDVLVIIPYTSVDMITIVL